MRPSVSVLCHTLSGNAFGRAWVLAELLRDDFDVHVVAACRPGDQIWAPVRESCTVEIRRWTPWSYPGFRARAAGLARRLVTGDVIYAVKPRLASYGLGLVARDVGARPRPLLLDVDDYEVGFSPLHRDLLHAPWALLSAASDVHTRLYTRRIPRADAVTVSNGFLQARYGGTWIPHARDERALAPASPSPAPADVRTIIFIGTPRKHKGLIALVRAFSRVEAPARLRLVGGTLDRSLSAYLAQHPDPRVSVEAPVPMTQLASLLASADIVAIPQDGSAVSQGQLPAKLLDAMAMGKAIVSTRVGDIPRWLDGGAGVVVEPDDEEALGRALDALVQRPDEVRALGQRARARFLAHGSYATVRPRLVELVARLARREPVPPSDVAGPHWAQAVEGASP